MKFFFVVKSHIGLVYLFPENTKFTKPPYLFILIMNLSIFTVCILYNKTAVIYSFPNAISKVALLRNCGNHFKVTAESVIFKFRH